MPRMYRRFICARTVPRIAGRVRGTKAHCLRWKEGSMARGSSGNTVCGISENTILSTSSIWSTGIISSPLRIRRGTSLRSFSFSRGMMTRAIRPRFAARSFSFRPPIGSTRPRKCDLTSHGQIIRERLLGEGGNRCGCHGYARGRAVFWGGAFGDMNMNIDFVIEIGLQPQTPRPGSHIAHSSLGRFLHHLAELAGHGELAGTRHRATSTMSSSPPTSVQAKSCRHADLLLFLFSPMPELGNSEEFADMTRFDQSNALRSCRPRLLGRLFGRLWRFAVPDLGLRPPACSGELS